MKTIFGADLTGAIWQLLGIIGQTNSTCKTPSPCLISPRRLELVSTAILGIV